MSEQRLIEGLVSSVGKVQTEVEVIELKQFTLDDIQDRTRRMLSLVGEQEQRSLERGDWIESEGLTSLRLAQGARAVLYHASGAMKYSSGMAPFDSLFEKVAEKEQLIKIVEESARKYDIAQWAGEQGELRFERLWQTKAQGFDKEGRKSEPVLTRVVGAYRHFVAGIPVLGAASVALKLTGNHALDMMSIQVRSSAAQTLDKARILNPEIAAKQMAVQLTGLLGQSLERLQDGMLEAVSMQFGYIDLGKRKTQRLLAPAYMAQITLRHEQEQQAYVLAVSATEKAYLPICQCGHETTAPPITKQGSRTILRPVG